VVGGLRVVRERLVADENHPASLALNHMPAVALKHEVSIERAAQRAGTLGWIRGIAQTTLAAQFIEVPKILSSLAGAIDSETRKTDSSNDSAAPEAAKF
jgi:hypothetical protein